MSSRKQWVVEIVTGVIGDKVSAEMVVDRLMEEGVLHLGHGNADIDIVVEQFQETFGTTKVSRYDRWAANRLVAKYGSQTVAGVIKLLGQSMGEKYAPVVGSIVQLETKWVSVMNFLRNLRTDDSEVIPNE